MTVTNKTPTEIPEREATYRNYQKRRNLIIGGLSQDMTIRDLAKALDKSQASIYTDLGKAMNETDTRTYWGLVVAAIRLGWIPAPGFTAERPS